MVCLYSANCEDNVKVHEQMIVLGVGKGSEHELCGGYIVTDDEKGMPILQLRQAY